MKLLVALLMLMSAQSVSAEEFSREGFLIGFNAGVADFEDENFLATADRYVGLDLNLYLGGSFSENFALMGLFNGILGQLSIFGKNVKVTNSLLAPVVQYSFTNGFVIRGGPGIAITKAKTSVSGVDYEGDRTGVGMYICPAFEFFRTGSFAIDLHTKFIPQWYSSDNGGFAYSFGGGLGFTWY